MTPKEKAEDLVAKFNNPDRTNYPYVHNAQQCALIAVNEMLNDYPSQVPKNSYEMVRHLFWQEVKQEIEKL